MNNILRVYFLLVFCILTTVLVAQNTLPIPNTWFKIQYSNANKGVIINLVDTLTAWDNSNHKLMNFHSIPEIDINRLSENIDISIDRPNQTIFSVYQDKIDQREQVIWSISQLDAPYVYATNNRVSNLIDSIDYLFSGINNDYLRLSTHFINTAKRQSDQFTFQIGKVADNNKPSFKGWLPEVLVFDRILSKFQRKQAETYLAIKYGIPLLSGSKIEYINSSGDVFWNAPTKGTFRYNIAGLGRDDFWGLDQKQATNSYEPNLITIGVGSIEKLNSQNHGQINNLSYLVWADNNQYSGQNKKENEFSDDLLDRRWQMSAIQFNELATELKLGIRQLKDDLQDNEQYWLVVDESGTNTFPVASSSYYAPQKDKGSHEYAYYSNVFWDKDQSGTDVFTFRAGKDMILAYETILPNCKLDNMGSLTMKIHGGKAPYQYSLQNLAGDFFSSSNWNGDLLFLDELPAGNYQINVTDTKGSVYSGHVDLHYSDFNKEDFLADEYLFLENNKLELTFPSSCPDCNYKWLLKDGKYSIDSEIIITEPGQYGLQVEKSNCTDTYFFTIGKRENTFFQSVELWNNPSSNGHYVLEVRLWQSSPIVISVYDQNGRLVLQETPPVNHYYKYTGTELASGIYNIQISSQGQSITKSLIMF